MNIAVIQISVRDLSSDKEATKALCEILNKGICERNNWHYFRQIVAFPTCKANSFVEFIQDNYAAWKSYDVFVLLLDQIFITDVDLCNQEMISLLKSGDRILINDDSRELKPEALMLRPRGTLFNYFFALIFQYGKYHEDVFTILANVLNQIPQKWLLASKSFISNCRSGFILNGNVLLAANEIFKGVYSGLRSGSAVSVMRPPRRYDSREKSSQELLLASELTKALFLYERVGYDSRQVSFSPDGKVGIGAAACEYFWDIEILSEGKPVLSLSSFDGLTCELTRDANHNWSGYWLRFEKMFVRLQPDLYYTCQETAICVTRKEESEERYKVTKALAGYNTEEEYDLNVSVLVHCHDQYAARAYSFVKYGLINFGSYRVHLTVIGSLGDSLHFDSLRQVADGHFDISFLEMGCSYPVPKINGHYLWLFKNHLKARWYLRVDDDSITDVSALMFHVDNTFGGQMIHLLSCPFDEEVGGPLFQTFAKSNGFILEHVCHEYESSISSSPAIEALAVCQESISFIQMTAGQINAPGDRALTLAMQLAKVPIAPNPRSTKNYDLNFSLIGGAYYHIHYVNWDDDVLLEFLEMYTHGNYTTVTSDSVLRFTGRPMVLTRAMGHAISTIILDTSGLGNDCITNKPLKWRYFGNRLQVFDSGMMQSVFDTIIDYKENTYLVGFDMKSNNMIYLASASK